MTPTLVIQEVDQERTAEDVPPFRDLGYVSFTNPVLQIEQLSKGGEWEKRYHPKFFVRDDNLQAILGRS